MNLTDLMESELSEHVEEQRVDIQYVEKKTNSNIRYVSNNRRNNNWSHTVAVQPTLMRYLTRPSGRPFTVGHSAKPNTPTRFELNTMRDRLNSHRRWIQVGILIGTIGLGSKVPTFLDWYSGANESLTPVVQECVEEKRPPVLNQESASRILNKLQTVASTLEKRVEENTREERNYQVKKEKMYQEQKNHLPKPVNVVAKTNNSYKKKSHYSPKSVRVVSPPRYRHNNSVGVHALNFTQRITSPDKKSFSSQYLTKNIEPTTQILKETVSAPYRPPKKICIKNSWKKRCYSRHSKDIHERQTYRRLLKKYQ